MINYKNTLNLPNTTFSMRANSKILEPQIQKFWNDEKIYEQNLKLRKITGKKFVLHDGPPYLSSSLIHIGTALNKILKDIIVKYKTLSGHYSPLIFGYDCHGLPIEHEVMKSISREQACLFPSTIEIRKRCKNFALSNLSGQQNNFKRLGILGDWDNPYLTLANEYEAAEIRVFKEFVKKDYIYKGFKPIYWCAHCETALAEAEVEYNDHHSHSIYVKFPLKSEIPLWDIEGLPVYFVIWTTTPWTLPANLAIALNPNFDYVFLKTQNHGVLVIAEKLLDFFIKDAHIEEEYEILLKINAKELENLVCKHPFYDRDSLVILGDFVTSDAGTGCVHIAPGHGTDDYEAGQKYNLSILSPLDNKGVFTQEALQYAGLYYESANKNIVQDLSKLNLLLSLNYIDHSYPHCWRCHKPVIYRATSQWFAAISPIRQTALDAIAKVNWYPAGSIDRISNMVQSRSDWCLSRQRVWGVPIPAFYCENCNTQLLNENTVEAVANLFEKQGSDSWWALNPDEILPKETRCEKCEGTKFRKESDIIDVWFDSGISHTAVVAQNPELGLPVDLYLEGSDQHRGWFQSSLLTSIAAHGMAPYKTVVTHGFTVDGHGRKMSKSLGNMIEPQQVIDQYGADILRLWVASVDYQDDIRVSMEILKQLAEIYKKIRNTARFLLGNLYDFNEENAIPYSKLPELEKYALYRLQEIVKQVTESFDDYSFYKFYQLIQNYCVVDLSNFYLDIVKDTLYIYPTGSYERLATQTALWDILYTLTRLMAPVLSHLAEDIWQNLPQGVKKDKPVSVFLSDYSSVKEEYQDLTLIKKWETITTARALVNKSLEIARNAKLIGAPLEAKVFIKIKNKEWEKWAIHELPLHKIFIVSQVEVIHELADKTYENEDMKILIHPADGEKCERCWNYSVTVSENETHPALCERCVNIITGVIINTSKT